VRVSQRRERTVECGGRIPNHLVKYIYLPDEPDVKATSERRLSGVQTAQVIPAVRTLSFEITVLLGSPSLGVGCWRSSHGRQDRTARDSRKRRVGDLEAKPLVERDVGGIGGLEPTRQAVAVGPFEDRPDET
jgi:hypothetical protein